MQISTLSVLNREDQATELSEDEILTSRQAARYACLAIKKYFEAHLAIKADQIRRSHVRNEGGLPLCEKPAYKVMIPVWIESTQGLWTELL